MLTALLKLMEVAYVCPAGTVYLHDPTPHLRAYLGLLPLIGGGQLSVAGLSTPAERAGGRLLASALLLLKVGDDDQLQLLRQKQRAVRLLEQPEVQQQLSRAVAALSAGRPEGQPPFTLQQLQFACHDDAASAALDLCLPTPASDLHSGGVAVASAILEALRQTPGAAEAAAAVRSAAAALWRLEPGHPKALDMAAQMLPDGFVAPEQATMQQLLSGMRRAEACGSALWTIRLAGAVAIATCGFHVQPAATPAEMQDLQHMLQRAEAALEGNKRLLPHPWVNLAQASIPTYNQTLHASQIAAAAAGAHAQQGGNMQAAYSAADQQTLATVFALANGIGQHTKTMVEARICNGCGQHAVGLRACARCRTAHYCSRECQAAHWPQHKRECRPA